jgi:hypothetical protein
MPGAVAGRTETGFFPINTCEGDGFFGKIIRDLATDIGGLLI